MKTVLLTGIGGSIGTHVLGDLMHNTDWRVVGIDSFRHKGYNERLRVTFEAHPDWKERVKVIQHDLTCPLPIELEDIDYVLHLAALSDVDLSIKSPAWVIKNNIDSTVMLLDYFTTTQLPEAFVYFSTDEVYGPAAEGHFHKEGEPHQPSNAYAASKAACEDICFAYWRSYGLPLVITNTMNNFGEMQSSSKFPAIVQRAVLSGEEVTIHGKEGEIGSRFYIHSRNAATALRFILQNTKPYLHQDGHIDRPDQYNIVGERELDNLEFAQMIANTIGKPLKYKLLDFHAARPGHDRRYALDGEKLAKMGWSAPLSLGESLAETLRWTEERPEWL